MVKKFRDIHFKRQSQQRQKTALLLNGIVPGQQKLPQ
jgi:hypothetical protein